MPPRSTLTNLSLYTNFLNVKIKNKTQVDPVYTDIGAAFDKVNHKIVLNKFKEAGVTLAMH